MARHIEQKHKAIYEELCLFTENCTTSPKSVQNYTDFKRINECINEVLGKEDVSILDFTDPIEFTDLIKLLNSNEKYKSYNKKGNNQYSSAVLNYQNFLFARHYAELVKTNSDTLNLQTIINEGLKDSYDQETLIEILKAYREVYASDNVKNNACDVAFGIKYGKFLEKTDTKTISQKASNPDDSNNIQNGYFVNIGVSTYQAICQEKYGLSFTKHQITNNSGDSIDQSHQQIFYGAPGTGKSHRIKKIIKEHDLDEKEQVIRTTFHPDSDYSTFVGCYKPIMKSVPQTYVVEGNEKPVMVNKDTQATKEEIVYNYTPQAFVQAYTKAWANPNMPIILVIEEINRGNCAQIFGDIFQLLDRGDDGVSDYEIKPDKALEDYLKGCFAGKNAVPEDIRNGEIMKLPANLYIWATMNTSDQSLFPIDSAFKRRWEWKYLPINNHEDKNYKIEIGGTKYDWWGFLSKINEVIGNTTSSEDKKLGYFFAKANENGFVTAEQFVGKVLFYLWNDVFKNYGFDNQIFDKGDKKKFDFSDFFKQDGSPNTDMVNKFLGKLDETIDKENTFVEKPKDDKGQEEPSDTEA